MNREPRAGDEVEVTLSGVVVDYDGELVYRFGPRRDYPLNVDSLRRRDARVVVLEGARAARAVTPERGLRRGDEVEVRLPALVNDDGLVQFRPPLGSAYLLARLRDAGAELIVTRPIDHPSLDPVGTVRSDGVAVWVKVNRYDDAAENFEAPYDDYTGVWWNVMCTGEEERTGDAVDEYPVIGVMPGTPAAELKEKNDGPG